MTYYDDLGLKQSDNPTTEQIKTAYRKLALRWHPDKNKEQDAQATFQKISEAYGVLSDPNKKQAYDTNPSQYVDPEASHTAHTYTDAFAEYADQWTKNNIFSSQQLNTLLKTHHAKQCKEKLDQNEFSLAELVHSGYALHTALHGISESNAQMVLDAVKNNLSTIIESSDQLKKVLEVLCSDQRGFVLNAIQNNLKNLMKPAWMFNPSEILKILNDTQCKLVLQSIDLPALIDSIAILNNILNSVSEQNCEIVLHAIQNNFSTLLKTHHDISLLLGKLSDTKKHFVLQAIRVELKACITSELQLTILLDTLDDESYLLVLVLFKDTLPDMFRDNPSALLKILTHLKYIALPTLLEQLNLDVKTLVTTRYLLNNALKNSDETQSTFILNTLADDLRSIVPDRSLIEFLSPLTETQQTLVLNILKNDLKHILQSRVRLSKLVKILNEDQQTLVLNTVEADLKDLTTYASDLRELLPALNNTQSKFVLNALKDNLKDIIPNGLVLGTLLQNLRPTQCQLVLDGLSPHLKQMFEANFSGIDAVVKHLNPAQSKVIIDTLKSMLNQAIRSSFNLLCILSTLDEQQNTMFFNDEDFAAAVKQFHTDNFIHALKVLCIILVVAVVTIAVAISVGLSLMPSVTLGAAVGISAGVYSDTIFNFFDTEKENKTPPDGLTQHEPSLELHHEAYTQ